MKYSVQFTRYTTVAVEAKSEEEAYSKANDWFTANIDSAGADDSDVLLFNQWPANQYEI